MKSWLPCGIRETSVDASRRLIFFCLPLLPLHIPLSGNAGHYGRSNTIIISDAFRSSEQKKLRQETLLQDGRGTKSTRTYTNKTVHPKDNMHPFTTFPEYLADVQFPTYISSTFSSHTPRRE